MNSNQGTDTQQADTLVVEMVSDLICPWCFVAKRRVEKAAAILRQKVEMRWLPFELNPDMPIDGLDRRMYRSAKFGSWEQSLGWMRRSRLPGQRLESRSIMNV